MIIKLKNIVDLLVLIYNYIIKRTQMFQNIVLSRDFSDKMLTRIGINFAVKNQIPIGC